MENKKKINWSNIFLAIFDCFWLWYSLSYMFEYYHSGHFTIAAIFGVTTIGWTLFLWIDAKDIQRKQKQEEQKDE